MIDLQLFEYKKESMMNKMNSLKGCVTSCILVSIHKLMIMKK